MIYLVIETIVFVPDIEILGGEIKEINYTISSKEWGRRLKEIASKRESQSLLLRIDKLEWSKEVGVATTVNISTEVDPELPLQVIFSNEALIFPLEPGSYVPGPPGSKVLTYVKVKMEAYNLSDTPVRWMHLEIAGAIGEQWQKIWDSGLEAPFEPRKSHSFDTSLPFEVLINGAKQRFEQYRVHVKKAALR